MKDLSTRCLDDLVAKKTVHAANAAGVFYIRDYGYISYPEVRDGKRKVTVHDSDERCRGWVSNRKARCLMRKAYD